MNGFKIVYEEHSKNIGNIFTMATKDLKKQYSGTIFGVIWSVIKNLIFVFAYWFTLFIGLKSGKDVGYPYIVWLITGLAAWFFIKDSLAPAASSIRKNKYLVTKMKYPVSIIPTFKVVSSFLTSLMFLVVVVIFAIIFKVNPSIYWIQILYYLFAAIILLSGIALTTSALVVVSKDIEMLINSTVFVLFWVSPILFPISNLSGNLALLVKLNPFYYIIEGFRNCILYKVWFWEQPVLTTYFWVFTVIMILIGMYVHGKLRNQFADVL